MTPAVALLFSSFRQLLPLKRSLLLAALELLPTLIYLLASSNRTEDAALEVFMDGGIAMYLVLILPIVSIVLAASALGVERRDQTLSFIVLRPIRRSVIVAVKLTATVAAAMVLNGVGAIALSGAHIIRFGASIDILIAVLVGAVVATIAYAAIFVPIGFLTDRAVIIGLAFLLIFENGVVSLLPGLETLSPWRLGASAFGDMAGVSSEGLDESLQQLALNAGRSLLVALAMAAASVVITTLLLNRRDLA
jgi:ABC-2 type transport system permease protein